MKGLIKNIFFTLFLTLAGLFQSNTLQAQNIRPDTLISRIEQLGSSILFQNLDSSYIKNYNDKFTVKLLAVNKINFFSFKDGNKNSRIRYSPETGINTGFGISYKWFAVDFIFNTGWGTGNNFKDQKSLDFQGRIFSGKRFIEATMQYYHGYELMKSSGLSHQLNNDIKIREDIRSMNFGLQYLYAFNYGKFSLRAPFVLNEIQRKSAGSIIAGANFSIVIIDADSSAIPSEVKPDFDEKIHLTDINTISLGINLGYIYTFVIREHFFLSLGFVPALNYITGDYKTDVREVLQSNFTFKGKIMGALGYNGKRI
jgi:hypothetical protein